MATKTVAELSEAASVAEADYLLCVSGGVTKKLPVSTLFKRRDVLELNKSAGEPPSEGTIRYAIGEIDEDLGYTPGFIDRVRGLDADGVTPVNVGLMWAYTQRNFVGVVQNIMGFGDWDAVDAKCPHLMRFNFRQNLSFNFARSNAEGDLSGFSMDSWPVSGVGIVYPGQVERRTLTVDRHTNFVVSGQRDHIVNPEDVMGHGEGVFYLGWADVRPTTPPTEGVIFHAFKDDSKVYYDRPNGKRVVVDIGPENDGLDITVTGDRTLSAVEAESCVVIVRGTLGGAFSLNLPNTKWKYFHIHNKTNQQLTAKHTAGGSTGVAIPAGTAAAVRHTGADYEPAP